MTGIRSPTGKIDRGDVEEGKSGPQHMLRATQLLPACDANYLSTKTEEERQKALLAISAGRWVQASGKGQRGECPSGVMTRGNFPGSASSMTSQSHLETVEERTGLLVLELRNKGPETTSPVSLK